MFSVSIELAALRLLLGALTDWDTLPIIKLMYSNYVLVDQRANKSVHFVLRNPKLLIFSSKAFK